MSIKTRLQIQEEIDNTIITNNDREITADTLNNIFTDINDSSLNQLTDSATVGLSEYSISKTYQTGQCSVYQNQLWKAISLVTGGAFDITKWSLQSPVKIWKARLTGVSGNIPTIELIKDDLFGSSQPFLTYIGTGVIRFEYNINVFDGIYSTTFDNTRSESTNTISFAMTNIVNDTTNDVYLFNTSFAATNDYETYFTLSVYN